MMRTSLSFSSLQTLNESKSAARIFLSVHLFLQNGTRKSAPCVHDIYMCVGQHDRAAAWRENTRTLCGYMYVGVRRRGKVQGWSMLSQGSVARATDWALLVVVIRVTCSLMRKLTEERGGEERDTEVEVLKEWGISLFRWVDILQGTSVYSGGIHGAPLPLRPLLQVVLKYRLFSICMKNTSRLMIITMLSHEPPYPQLVCAHHLNNDHRVSFTPPFGNTKADPGSGVRTKLVYYPLGQEK